MTDFRQFYTNNANAANSNFKETFTTEVIKASQGNAPLNVLPCKDKPGKCFFACGAIRGSVAQELADKIAAKKPFGNLVVSHVVNDGSDPKYPNKFDGLMLHEESANTNVLLSI